MGSIVWQRCLGGTDYESPYAPFYNTSEEILFLAIHFQTMVMLQAIIHIQADWIYGLPGLIPVVH
jgi:hypothetical protein